MFFSLWTKSYTEMEQVAHLKDVMQGLLLVSQSENFQCINETHLFFITQICCDTS